MAERPTNDHFEAETSFAATDDQQELSGNEITQEQIRDVYFAGTSDGVVYLGNTKVLNLEEGEQTE
ncbi:hypothetical protein [Alicyclobacillus acidoterrestris]|uniref:Uncharacterized protein n=1 Tax=Alicyclobacillus acidoterrestris (strain ATCC 49025 / DSM 3922 / CIP 106132 / NCIMB 13137 / GD3B) TaxID=1356854 RepID=T0BM32_ALIAG|nr:hypothetical protein [Alicyclobacillus acidoterrestris]EPZ45038.1 hypothetical protein N007_09500 [Alicyclobacillus acidoterrestris ATCC 49025]UNO48326.1 hypothetical protein K1I37_16875 [Alicyclobacillus acidoterrestris]